MSITEARARAEAAFTRYNDRNDDLYRAPAPFVAIAKDLLAALPETPTTDDREAAFKIIYGYETIDFRESQNFTTRDCYGVVDALLAAGFRRPSPPTEEQWEYGIEYIPGYRQFDGRSREHHEAQVRAIHQGSPHARAARVIRRRPAGESEPVEAAAPAGGEA